MGYYDNPVGSGALGSTYNDSVVLCPKTNGKLFTYPYYDGTTLRSIEVEPFELINIKIEVKGIVEYQKKIVLNQQGTVKQLIQRGDYAISIEGVITSFVLNGEKVDSRSIVEALQPCLNTGFHIPVKCKALNSIHSIYYLVIKEDSYVYDCTDFVQISINAESDADQYPLELVNQQQE